MGLQFWASIVIAVCCPLIVAVVWYFLRRFIKEWEAREAKRELYYVKVDCMIVGLKKMNGAMSAKFEQEYDNEFDSRTKDVDMLKKLIKNGD